MSEVVLSVIGYIVAFVIFTIKIDKRVSLLEQTFKMMADSLSTYSDLQLRIAKQEITTEQLQSAIEDLKNEYRELVGRLDKR